MLPSIAKALAEDMGNYIDYLEEGDGNVVFWTEYDKQSKKLEPGSERLEFNTRIQKMIQHNLEEHLHTCSYPSGPDYFKCDVNKGYTLALRRLKKLEVSITGAPAEGEDVISVTEFSVFNEKVDKILETLNKLELGQEILYQKVEEDIAELKTLYYLGKKKWYQVAKGKIVDGIGSELLGEAVAKPLLEMVSSM